MRSQFDRLRISVLPVDTHPHLCSRHCGRPSLSHPTGRVAHHYTWRTTTILLTMQGLELETIPIF